MMQISFEPLVDDSFDDERCRVAIDTGRFRGEARYRNQSPSDFEELLIAVRQYPISKPLNGEWFDGLFKLQIEPIDRRGILRLQATVTEEIDSNSVSIDVGITYEALQRFARELAALIDKSVGTATL